MDFLKEFWKYLQAFLVLFASIYSGWSLLRDKIYYRRGLGVSIGHSHLIKSDNDIYCFLKINFWNKFDTIVPIEDIILIIKNNGKILKYLPLVEVDLYDWARAKISLPPQPDLYAFKSPYAPPVLGKGHTSCSLLFQFDAVINEEGTDNQLNGKVDLELSLLVRGEWIKRYKSQITINKLEAFITSLENENLNASRTSLH